MKKRLIALTLLIAMLVSVSPSVVADDTEQRPTVEEILSEYHQKAFEAKQAGGTSANSRSVENSGKTLEEETVDALNAAGYEAYNVTSENYETLEQQLRTDFSEMGLDPNGSYIITLSGEENSASNNSRAYGDNLITPTPPPDVGGADFFLYTYNGVEYKMRYLTITAAENPDFAQSTTVDVLSTYGETLLNSLLNNALTIYLDAISGPFNFGTLFSIFGLDVTGSYTTRNSSLSLTAMTNWTRRYIQVWDAYDELWAYGSCTEYAIIDATYIGYVYNARTNTPMQIQERIIENKYAADYNNPTQQKNDAVLGYLEGDTRYDITGNISYYHGNTRLFIHYEDYI